MVPAIGLITPNLDFARGVWLERSKEEEGGASLLEEPTSSWRSDWPRALESRTMLGAEDGAGRGARSSERLPADGDGHLPSFPSTPARRRESPPALGPPSVGSAPKTPFRDAHNWSGVEASSPSSRPCEDYHGSEGGGHEHMPRRRAWRGSFSISHLLMQRESRSSRMMVPRGLLQDFVSTSKSTYQIGGENSMDGSPPFSMRWGQTKREGTLAVADEEGHVTLINTRIPKAERTNPYHWPCHRNAIFDIALADGDDLIASASGDQTIRVWDLSRTHPVLKATLRGHGGSVKSVQFRPGSQNELVSGAREGSILFWDVRAPDGNTASAPTQNVGPAQAIPNAHVREDQRSLATSKAKRSAGTQHSVTSVVFIDDTVVATAGANDGVVKLWDLRKSFSFGGKGGGAGHVKSFLSREASATGRARGISSLAVNATRNKLLASSADHHIYIFDCIVPEVEPTIFSGHVHNGFYVKSSFSPDGRYIVSGSSDECVYIWDVSTPLLPPIRLRGHKGEVSDVRWCPTDMTKLASSSDDTTVRVWSIDRERRQRKLEGEEEAAQGQRFRDGWAEQSDTNDVGEAEVPESWSQPSLRSEDDLLSCNETMFVSDTTNHTSTSSMVIGGSVAMTPIVARGPSSSPSQWFNSTPSGFGEREPGGHAGLATSPIPLPTSPAPAPTAASASAPLQQQQQQHDREGSASPGLKQAKLDDIWKKPRSSSPRDEGEGEGEREQMVSRKQARIYDMFRPAAVAARLIMGGGDEHGAGGGRENNGLIEQDSNAAAAATAAAGEMLGSSSKSSSGSGSGRKRKAHEGGAGARSGGGAKERLKWPPS